MDIALNSCYLRIMLMKKSLIKGEDYTMLAGEGLTPSPPPPPPIPEILDMMRIPMNPCGSLWIPMDAHGCPCNPQILITFYLFAVPEDAPDS